MRISALFFGIVAVSLTACTANPWRPATEGEILVKTKRLAIDECRPQEFEWNLHVSGCEYNAKVIDGKWSVLVDVIVLKKDGSPSGVMGAHSLYMFTKNGTFIQRIPGM